MNKIKAVLIEAREDQNEESSRASVLTKASKEQKPDRRQPKAAVAGTDDEKGGKAVDTKGMPGPTAKAKPKAKAKASGKGDKEPNPKKETNPKGKDNKDKGKGKGKETKDPNPKAKSKPTIACLFYPKGTCTRGAPSKATVAAVIGSAGVSGALASNVAQCSSDVLFRRTLKRSPWSMIKSSFAAIMKPIVTLLSCVVGVTEPQGAATQPALCASFGVGVKDAFPCIPSFAVGCTEPQGAATQASLCASGGVGVKDAFPCMPAILSNGTALYAQSSRQVDWIADSGAGRDLGSDRAFAQQGFSKEMANQNLIGVPPTKFETGNGSYTSDTCVQLTGHHFGEAQFNMMVDCPCAFNGTDCCVRKALHLDTRSSAISS